MQTEGEGRGGEPVSITAIAKYAGRTGQLQGESDKGTVRSTGKNVDGGSVNCCSLFPCRAWQPLAGIGGWNKS